MEFTLGDIQNLYGDYFFYLKEEQAQAPSSSVVEEAQRHLFTEGEAIDWKMKPDSLVALVLAEDEFADKDATSQLKQWVLQAELSPQHIGFGIIPASAKAIHFNDMPVKIAVVFGAPESPTQDSISLADKDIFILSRIHELLSSSHGKDQAVSILKQAKFMIP